MKNTKHALRDFTREILHRFILQHEGNHHTEENKESCGVLLYRNRKFFRWNSFVSQSLLYLQKRIPCLYLWCTLLVVFTLFSMENVSLAQGNIVDYFLKNPSAWEDTKRIIHKEPTKIVVADGLKGLGFNLAELTEGDEVALVFIESQKAERLKYKGFCNGEDKLLPGKNRVVSVITRNSGDRTRFHYKFILQRNVNSEPVTIYNNGNAILESIYDGGLPVRDISNLSGIELCEIEVHSNW